MKEKPAHFDQFLEQKKRLQSSLDAFLQIKFSQFLEEVREKLIRMHHPVHGDLSENPTVLTREAHVLAELWLAHFMIYKLKQKGGPKISYDPYEMIGIRTLDDLIRFYQERFLKNSFWETEKGKKSAQLERMIQRQAKEFLLNPSKHSRDDESSLNEYVSIGEFRLNHHLLEALKEKSEFQRIPHQLRGPWILFPSIEVEMGFSFETNHLELRSGDYMRRHFRRLELESALRSDEAENIFIPIVIYHTRTALFLSARPTMLIQNATDMIESFVEEMVFQNEDIQSVVRELVRPGDKPLYEKMELILRQQDPEKMKESLREFLEDEDCKRAFFDAILKKIISLMIDRTVMGNILDISEPAMPLTSEELQTVFETAELWNNDFTSEHEFFLTPGNFLRFQKAMDPELGEKLFGSLFSWYRQQKRENLVRLAESSRTFAIDQSSGITPKEIVERLQWKLKYVREALQGRPNKSVQTFDRLLQETRLALHLILLYRRQKTFILEEARKQIQRMQKEF